MLRDTPMKSADANASIRRLTEYKLPDEVEATMSDTLSLEDFVKSFVKNWALRHPTIYAHSGMVQTAAGKRRSLGDITRLCQYYYDNVCLEMVKQILKDLVNAGEISTDICDTIHKRVYFFRATKSQTIDETEDRDEYGWRLNLEKKTKIPRFLQS